MIERVVPDGLRFFRKFAPAAEATRHAEGAHKWKLPMPLIWTYSHADKGEQVRQEIS